jgi:hypothetical protein
MRARMHAIFRTVEPVAFLPGAVEVAPGRVGSGEAVEAPVGLAFGTTKKTALRRSSLNPWAVLQDQAPEKPLDRPLGH